jgi:hypothetical protein
MLHAHVAAACIQKFEILWHLSCLCHFMSLLVMLHWHLCCLPIRLFMLPHTHTALHYSWEKASNCSAQHPKSRSHYSQGCITKLAEVSCLPRNLQAGMSLHTDIHKQTKVADLAQQATGRYATPYTYLQRAYWIGKLAQLRTQSGVTH